MLIDIGELEVTRPGDGNTKQKGKARFLLHVPDEEMTQLFDEQQIQKLKKNRKCLIL